MGTQRQIYQKANVFSKENVDEVHSSVVGVEFPFDVLIMNIKDSTV